MRPGVIASVSLRALPPHLCVGAALLPGSRRFAGVFSLDGRRLLLNGAASDGMRVAYEGQARGAGFVIVATHAAGDEAGELELGFEPSLDRPTD